MKKYEKYTFLSKFLNHNPKSIIFQYKNENCPKIAVFDKFI